MNSESKLEAVCPQLRAMATENLTALVAVEVDVTLDAKWYQVRFDRGRVGQMCFVY